MIVFPVRIANGINELKHVFPSKQNDVQNAVEAIKNQNKINRLIVFGSSITYNCGIGSDLDIAIDAPGIKTEDEFLELIKPIKKAIKSESDIIHFNCIQNELLKSEITNKGLSIYVNRV